MQKVILAALWFGKKKPDMVLFQDAFVDSVNNLSEKGFNLEHHGRAKTFKAFCICCAADAVARAPMQGIMQFNAYHGCNWCLQKGESFKFHNVSSTTNSTGKNRATNDTGYGTSCCWRQARKWCQNCVATDQVGALQYSVGVRPRIYALHIAWACKAVHGTVVE